MKVKAILSVIVGGLITAAVVTLVLFQWASVASFSLYGYGFTPYYRGEGGRLIGGVNTALLMLCSAVGGLITWHAVKMLFKGIWALRRLRRDAAKRAAEVQHAVQAQRSDDATPKSE